MPRRRDFTRTPTVPRLKHLRPGTTDAGEHSNEQRALSQTRAWAREVAAERHQQKVRAISHAHGLARAAMRVASTAPPGRQRAAHARARNLTHAAWMLAHRYAIRLHAKLPEFPPPPRTLAADRHRLMRGEYATREEHADAWVTKAYRAAARTTYAKDRKLYLSHAAFWTSKRNDAKIGRIHTAAPVTTIPHAYHPLQGGL